MKTSTSKRKTYTPREIVEKALLPFSERTILNLIREGRLKATNVGAGTKKSRWRIDEKEIRRFNA